ncbi:SoxR reducing system RseC family protein [Beggiatoa leptomitoformis]|uniref:Fis family transcriptional regulator n=1 Tax=Beggiatoa leptomitoformis TaxID=288004 RepID=A0A2N9YC53_9GAMM|nr:SoxR reducing system RseC family protein [Beggiatoa leptomitoformis]ALG66680.1 Fis family transcriptional regulator [Beggiatoa leptomitoformis]AUI67994.1 Fis family transcriptional regulator [Beggiatoa leptomitoformis]
MLEEEGVVVEATEQFVWVRTQRTSGCSHCTVNSCGTGSLDGLFGQKVNEVKVINNLSAKLGDKVVIGLEEQALVRGSLLLYILPLLFLFAVAVSYENIAASVGLPSGDGWTALAGLVGLAGGLGVARYLSALLSEDSRYQPILLKIATPTLYYQPNFNK